MTDVLEPTAGRPAPARRLSRRSTAVAASLSLLAAGVGGTLVRAAAPAQAANALYFIAVVVPWDRVDDVHSFRIIYTTGARGGGLGPRLTTDCYTDVEFTDAMNYWSEPYTTTKVALDPATIPFKVLYFSSDDCSTGGIAAVPYFGDDVVLGTKYVYTNKVF